MSLALSVVKTTSQRLTLLINEEVWRTFHYAIISASQLPSCIDNLQTLETLFVELEWQGAKRFALSRLAQRDLSSLQMRQQLNRRLVSSQTIDRLLTYLQEKQLLNDERMAQAFMASQVRRLYGPKHTALKLSQKGLPSVSLENYDQESAILQLLTTRYRQRNLNDPKQQRSVINSLLRRGFDFNSIKKALRLSFEEPS